MAGADRDKAGSPAAAIAAVLLVEANVTAGAPAPEDGDKAVNQALSVAVAASLFGAICLILRERGARAVANACLFVASLVATQLSVKVLVSPPYKYRFPGLVTVLHFSSVSVACALYWISVGEPGKILPCSLGSWRRWSRTVLPIALSQPVSVVFNNKAMVYVGAGVCAVIGTLSPVATAVLSRACGRDLAALSWLGVLVAFGGALVISWGEVEQVEQSGMGGREKAAVMTGLLFAFSSLLGRSIKIVIMDFMLAPLAYSPEGGRDFGGPPEAPLPLLHVYMLTFPVGALASLAYALNTEDAAKAWRDLRPEVLQVLLLTCVCALALNFLGGFVLRDLGASAQQIIGKLNTICSLAISVGFLGERLAPVVLLGTALVLAGVAVFECGERRVQQRRELGASSSSCGSSSAEEDSEDDPSELGYTKPSR